jgi:RNA polymerase sigma-70 factor (ECF subfamily)
MGSLDVTTSGWEYAMPEAPVDAAAPDDLLVGLARGGDRAALEELFRRHAGVAYRVAYRLLGHEHDAHDAVQDGLLKAMTHLDDFDGRSGFRTWLLKIVSNAALDAGRRRRRRPTVPLGDAEFGGIDPSIEDDPTLGLRRKDLDAALRAALDRLSPENRLTFVLFAEGGCSYKEIAAILEKPDGTVMSRIHYARQKLQTYLEGVDGL